MGASSPRFGSFAFGRLGSHRLSYIAREESFLAVSAEIQAGVSACARDCQYFRWCGGGAPANKLFETGRFDATETMHCRLTRQAIFDEALNGVERTLRSPVAV
jgi:uncharacterized protein